MEKLNYINDPADDDDNDVDVDKLIKSVTRDYQRNGIIQSVVFSRNGNSFCLSFLDNALMLCSTSMWDVRRVIKFPDFFIKQCDFISSPHEYNPTMLLALTSNDDLMLTSLKDLNSKMLIEMNNSCGFVVSSNGKVLMNIHSAGDILVYNFDHCVNAAVDVDLRGCEKVSEKTTIANDGKCTKQERIEWNAELDKIQMKVISIKLSMSIVNNKHNERKTASNLAQSPLALERLSSCAQQQNPANSCRFRNNSNEKENLIKFHGSLNISFVYDESCFRRKFSDSVNGYNIEPKALNLSKN